MPLGYIRACEYGVWHVETWRRDDPSGTRRRYVYKCRSWRHEGECREWCGACDFRRVEQAVLEHDHWTYLVLTYPRKQYPDLRSLFRRGVVHWSRLRKRLTHRFPDLKYIQTWESHRSGWPHCNVVISHPGLYRLAMMRGNAWKREFLEPALEECGFGKISYLKPMRDASKMAGYLTKLAKELTGAGVKGQVPVNAPKNFRRIRASRGLLPKRLKDLEITGCLRKVPIPDDSHFARGYLASLVDGSITVLQEDGESVYLPGMGPGAGEEAGVYRPRGKRIKAI